MPTRLRIVHIITLFIAVSLASTMEIAGDRPTKNNRGYGNVQKVSVGIYWDSSCSNATESIYWGSLMAGNSKNISIYVRNEGRVPATLSLSTQEWNPANANSHFSLSWDKEGTLADPKTVIPAILTLQASLNASETPIFSFTTIVTCTV